MKITTDFLIIGTGIAGLSYALKVADQGTVSLVTKRDIDISKKENQNLGKIHLIINIF